jgi:hypothetical protein
MLGGGSNFVNSIIALKTGHYLTRSVTSNGLRKTGSQKLFFIFIFILSVVLQL